MNLNELFQVLRLKEPVFAGLLIAIYLVLATISLDQPGLYYDEAFQVPSAIYLVQGEISGRSVTTLGRYHLTLFQTQLPLMHLEYLGAVKSYFFLPLFSLFGINTVTVRATTILIGAGALLFTYLFLREAFTQRIALLSLSLLATDVSYILTTRLDWGPVSIMMLCKMAALFFLIRWWKSFHRGYLMLGAFFIGLGLWDKANFIWFLLALSTGAAILYWRQLVQKISWGNFGLAVICFLAGSSGLLLYNIAYPGVTILPQLRAISTFFGEQSLLLNPEESIFTRLNVLISVFRGFAVPQLVLGDAFSSGKWVVGSILPYVLLSSILALTLFYTIIAKQWPEKRVLFIYTLPIFILLQIFITVQAGGAHHTMMVYPFPHILVALALDKIIPPRLSLQPIISPFRLLWFLGVGTVLLGVVISNITVIGKFYGLVERTGGTGNWSDAIYNLADYLKGERRVIVCMDWGFNNNLIVLSRGKLHTIEPIWGLDWNRDHYHYMTKERFKLTLRHIDVSNCCLFLLHSREFSNFKNPSLIFFRVVQELHWRAIPVQNFYQKDGRLIS